MATTNQNSFRQSQPDDFIRIQDLFYLCLARWGWFVISFIVCMGLAAFYIMKTPPTYTRSASLLIKDESSGKSQLGGDIGSTFSEMGLFQSNTNVNNELISLKTSSLMEDVIRRLHLNVTYMTQSRLYKKVAYGKVLPFTVTFNDLSEEESAGFVLVPYKNGKVYLSEFTRNGEILDGTATGIINDTLKTPVGKVVVTPTQYYASGEAPLGDKIFVTQISMKAATAQFSNSLSVALSDDNSTVINLTFTDYNIQRAEDVLNTLIEIYNENWILDKNQIAISTSTFINERLNVIEGELGNVDEDISSFKSQNLLPNVEAASSMYMARSSETQSQLLALNTQLSVARYVRNYVTNVANRNQPLPANSGLESPAIENQIIEFNSMLLNRNNLVANSSEKNPLVVDHDRNLNTLRGAIVASIDNLTATIQTQIRSLERSEQQTTQKIASNPTQAKYLLSVERQQKVKEALYLFLLQKREENELSQAFTAYNTRVIDPPKGSNLPTAPVKRNILLVAFALALLIPIATVFLMETLNTSVRGRKDLENLSMPFVGEIPLSYRKKKHWFTPKSAAEKEKHTIVVKNHSRNVINEAFRVVRANLEFIIGQESKNKVCMITSINSGSGKTFITMNLATSLAINGKRVLAIDLDLRKASLSAYVESPKQGVADYLAGRVGSYEDVIVRGEVNPNLDVIPVGTIPPNPTELLYTKNLKEMLTELRSRYDFIFIDCPPIEIVADASIINKYSEITLFIIRAGLLDRAMLPEIERSYTERKYNNMSLILNGTEGGSGKYGYKYGYRYGYKYGYKYGYSGYTKD